MRDETSQINGSSILISQNQTDDGFDRETLFSVLEKLPIGVYIADKCGRIIYGNKAGQEIWSGLKYVTPDKFTEYKGWWVDTGKEITSDEWALSRAVKHSQISRDEEIEIECFDGTHKIILNSAYPLFDNNRQVCGGFATNQDITAIRAAEKENRRLADFPQQNPFPVLQFTIDGYVLYSNTSGKDTIDELGNKDGKLLNIRWMEIIKKVLHTQLAMNEELQVKNRFMSFSFVPVSNEKVNIYGLDISDRKEAESKLSIERDLLQSIINGARNSHLVYLDREFNFVHVNAAYAETCGYTPEEMIGKNHFTLYPDDENEAIFTRVRDSGEPFEIHDKPFEFPDQPERGITYWDWALTPVKNSEDTVVGLVFSLFETTERKRTNDAIARTHKLESLGHLAAGIAHDFNNLLGGIYGCIDLALFEGISKEAENHLAEAASTINRAKHITQQLITFSKGGAPQLDIHDIVSVVQSSVFSTLNGSSVTAEFIVPETVWQCRFDAAQFSQVMHNITQNALDAMPEHGKIVVKISNQRINNDSGKSFAQGNYIRVSISDTGPGISDDDQNRIFDPFFSTKELGRGLGLTTSFSIISRHGGAIEVDSTAQAGSTLHVYLPAVDTIERSNTQKKVLLMDDEELFLQTTAQILKKLDFQVTIARNGEEALKEFISAKNTGVPFTVLILDLMIRRGWGGIRTLEEIRKFDTEIPVIVASGYSHDPVMANPEQYGFSYSISKPFNMLELSELLKKVSGVST